MENGNQPGERRAAACDSEGENEEEIVPSQSIKRSDVKLKRVEGGGECVLARESERESEKFY